ncbi:MAG: ATP-binding protein [Byssovorax sp.]
MARISDLVNVFHAVSLGDLALARVLALRVIDTEENAGHHGAAASLRGALASTGPRVEHPENGNAEVFRALPILPDVLELLPPLSPGDVVRLSADARLILEEVLNEYRHRALLRTNQLRPRNRLFFYGPPGCGKTLTARHIGRELDLSVFVVRFDALIGSYLGQTSLRIRELFRFVESHACVLLIDEIDAIGRKRGSPVDVGELDRVVIALMQQLELTNPEGFVIAASNVPNELDAALLRRFDLALEFPAPSARQIRAFARTEADKRGLSLLSGIRQQLATAKTYADVEKIILTEHRRSVLRRL